MLCTLQSTGHAIFFLQQLLFLHSSDLWTCAGRSNYSGCDGWEEDLIFKGGLGAGRKSNPGGLSGASFICNLN